MAMGTRTQEARQGELWIATSEVVQTPGHAFYDRLEEVLCAHRFDACVEHLCRRYYPGRRGRPSMPPGVYFRLLLIGYFEGLDSERAIAWRAADSLSLRRFLGYDLNEATPDHSTLSRTRRLFWLSTHQAVFGWVARLLHEEGLLVGRTVAVDATTLEANAAMRSIVRREGGESYTEYVRKLAQAAGEEDPTPEQLQRFDRRRKKRTSNRDWKHPHDPDARIAKMKDGRTRLAHKAEHAVDLESGALLAITLQPADRGDTTTLQHTLPAADRVLRGAKEEAAKEVVTDKGYHSGGVLVYLNEAGKRGYVSEPERGRRKWMGRGKACEQRLLYGNRRRLRGRRSKELQRRRAERAERAFAHMYETGGMRRTHLRGHRNILKRLLVHGAGFNLSLLMRKRYGAGKPRCMQGRSSGGLEGSSGLRGSKHGLFGAVSAHVGAVFGWWTAIGYELAHLRALNSWNGPAAPMPHASLGCAPAA